MTFVRRQTRDLGWTQTFLSPLAFQWLRYLTLHLTRLYATLEHPDQVLSATLPPRYVAKPTHSSGLLMLVERDEPSIRVRLASEARRWFAHRHHFRTGEWAYEGLPPRLMLEEWLDDGVHQVPPDWKWFCFHGHAEIVECDRGRYGNRTRNFCTPDGRPVDATLLYPRGDDVAPPLCFPEMRRIAEALSRPFDFVRVDLYALEDRVVVGELTHYPSAGMQVFSPAPWDQRLGAMWEQHRATEREAGFAGHQSHQPCSHQVASLR